MRVIAATPKWSLNGVNVFSAHLVRELNLRGHDASILLTRPDPGEPESFPLPQGVPIDRLNVSPGLGLAERSIAFAHVIERLKPCVLLPGYDVALGRISAALDPRVRVVGVLHTHEDAYYRFLKQAGPAWNQVVAVSRHIEDTVSRTHPEFVKHLSRIPCGIAPPPPVDRAPLLAGEPLRVVYGGRLSSNQKRMFDLLAAISQAQGLGARVHLEVAGTGHLEAEMRAKAADTLAPDSFRFLGALSNEDTLGLFGRSHVFMLMTEREGLPVSLIEAMAMGCVPIVSDLESGVGELIEHGRNGFLTPRGDTLLPAQILNRLAADHTLLGRAAAQAEATGRSSEYSAATMAEAYLEVFERAFRGPDPPRLAVSDWLSALRAAPQHVAGEEGTGPASLR